MTENRARAYLQKLRLFNRDVRLYMITAVLIGLNWMGIYAVLFNLYLLRLEYDLAFIGLVNAVAMLAYALFSLPGGFLGGRWGARPVMIMGFCLAVMGLALPPLAESLPGAWRAGWLVTTYPIGMLGAALFVVNADVYLMGATSPAERSYVFSVQVALWPLAGFAGSLIGGVLPRLLATAFGLPLEDPVSYRYALWLSGGLAALGIPPLLATRPVSTGQRAQQVSETGTAPYGLIAVLALVQLLQGAGEGAARTFFNVYLDGELAVATSLIGTLAALGQLAAVPAALAAPLLLARWRNGPAFVRSSLAMAFSLLPLALVRHWGAAGLGLMGVIAAGSIYRPAFLLYRMEIVFQSWRALLNGAVNTAYGLSWAVIGLGGAYVVQNLGYSSLFLIGAFLTAAGTLLFWVYDRVPRGL